MVRARLPMRTVRMVGSLVRDEPFGIGRMDPAWSVDGWAVTQTQPAPHLRALPLARLDALLEQTWDHRLTLIVAPAGSGKSTLLGRFVAAAPGPVAWYRADAWDRDPVRMLRHLESALRAAVPALPTGWETMEDALDSLIATELPPGLLLVIDDLHALASTDAERRLERLIERCLLYTSDAADEL